jgi:hypothetical protein
VCSSGGALDGDEVAFSNHLLNGEMDVLKRGKPIGDMGFEDLRRTRGGSVGRTRAELVRDAVGREEVSCGRVAALVSKLIEEAKDNSLVLFSGHSIDPIECPEA